MNISASKGDIITVQHLLKDGADANAKDVHGRTPLHYAVTNGHIDIVTVLLKNGADVTQVTNKGNTPLHIATFKGYKEIATVLLQHVSHDKLNDFVNAKTTATWTSSLHVAVEGGFLEIVISLLKHGAIYNTENKEGKIPMDLSKDQKITNFLKLIKELFREVKSGNVEAISKLRAVKSDEFLAVTNARNNQGNTLLQVAIVNKYETIAGELLKMLKDSDKTRSQFNPEYELDQLKILKRVAENHIYFSEIYLALLRNICEWYDKNPQPWRTLKVGSYYLGNAYNLVEVCKDCMLGSIDNKNIQSVNDMLVALEFDPKHISSEYTDEFYGKEVEFFVSKGQGTEYYKLLHSELNKNVRSFIEMVELYIDIPVKKFLESIKKRIPFSEKLLDAIENDNLLAVENCIKRVVDVNCQGTDGRIPLHNAINKGNKDIVSILLIHGADVAQIANNGDTPLHIASSKGYKEIVEVLLQFVSRDKLNDFINAKTAFGGTTSLHAATENGFLEVVKSLLKHGAVYNIENKEGKIPIDFSKDQKVTNFLKLIEELFREIKNGNVEAISMLRAVKPDDFLAITNARNNEGNTLLQVAIVNKHTDVAGKLFKMLNDPEQIGSQFSPEYELNQLKYLKRAAEIHIDFSRLYLPMLRSLSQSHDSERNTNPWKTLKEGSYYLGNAYKLVRVWKCCMLGSIDNESMQSVNDLLVALEFNPKHISSGKTDEAYYGRANCFVSKGQGTKYYELLHSELNKDVRSFIEMVELYIDIPVKRFLESIKARLPFSEKLLDAIQNDNPLAVENCIKNYVNFRDTDGKTPLHHAVNKGNKDIVSTLLIHGADAAQIANNGDTPLHIASFKGYKEIVEVLLQFVSRDKLNDFINAKTDSFGGTTSLHVAAKNGFLEVVKSLLKHGAAYNIENKEGKMPTDLSKDQKVINFLKLIDELFREMENGNVEVISKLIAVKPDEFLAITNACNNEGNTLLQVAIANGHKNIADKLLKMLKDPEKFRSQFRLEYELDQLKKLKKAAENHIHFSELYLPMLRSISQSHGSEKNTNPWKTLKEGSYYLGNAYKLVEVWKDCMLSSIDNKSIQSVNDILVALEFDPKHISSGYTDEAYGGRAECFVSRGQGTKYYKLLHSELKKDVRSFIEMVDLYIDIPVKRFLESIKARLPFSEKLLGAIENENPLAEGCLIF